MISNANLSRFLLAALAFFNSFSGIFIYLFFQGNPYVGSVIIQSIYTVLFLASLLSSSTIVKNNRTFLNLILRNRALVSLFLFFSFEFISISFSETDKLVSLAYVIRTLSFIFIIISAACYYKQYNFLDVFAQYFIFGTVLSFILFISNSQFSDYRFGDIEFYHPNSIGRLASFSILLLCYLISKKNNGKLILNGKESLIFFFLLFILFLTFSKTSLVSLILALISFAIIGGRINFISIIIIFISCIAIFYFSVEKIYHYIYEQASGLAFETLTGRTELWQYTWTMIKEKIILGHGYNSFRYIGPDIFIAKMPQAHNEVLNILFSYGLIGFFLYLFCIYFFIIQSYKTRSIPLKKLGCSLLIMSILRGLTEAHLFGIILTYELYISISIAIILHINTLQVHNSNKDVKVTFSTQ